MAEISRVVIPIDFSSNTDKVVEYGLSIADKLGAQVLFFHVINNFQGYDMMLMHPSFLGMTKDLELKAEEHMAALVKKYAQREGGATGNVIVGDAADEFSLFVALSLLHSLSRTLGYAKLFLRSFQHCSNRLFFSLAWCVNPR